MDDYEGALNRVTPYYITIIYKDDQEAGHSNIESYEQVIGDFYFENLVSDFGQAKDAISYIYQVKKSVICGSGEIYLGFEKDKKIFKEYSWSLTDEIYCKDILVMNTHLTIPFILNGFKISKLVLNSKHKDLVPNVARNDFSDEVKKELSYAIGKAIHM